MHHTTIMPDEYPDIDLSKTAHDMPPDEFTELNSMLTKVQMGFCCLPGIKGYLHTIN